MSLTTALHVTMAGLSKTESQISVVSSNVTNADKAGYTVKRFQTDYVTANGMTVPISGTIVGSLDMDIYGSVIESMTDHGYFSTIADYLWDYTAFLGTTDGNDTLSSYMDNLEATISTLETSPSDSSAKVMVIDAAETIVRELKNLSSSVQGGRLEADLEIERSVTSINQLLENLDALNEQIMLLEVNGSSTADAEDERMCAMEKLSEYLDIAYYINDNNQIKIYTTTGKTLLDSNVHEVTHTAVTSVSSANVYPGGFAGITVDSTDITTSIQSGKIAALIELRDSILVAEQDKLDEFAAVLIDTVNTTFNEGTSYPACSELTSDLDALVAGDAFAGAGIVRIATVDEGGIVQGLTDLDLSAYATIGALVTGIDSIVGISAVLNANGELVMTADNAGEGISMNQMTSSIGAGADSFGMYFGFSNVFTNVGAEYIDVCGYLSTSSESLASSFFDDDAALAIGDVGLVAGNGTIVTAVFAALTGSASFAAAGGFSAQSSTLSYYANKIVAYVANASENTAIESETAQRLYEGLKRTMENATGVNIDEETAKMVELGNQYGVSATILSTLQELFDTLINAVR
ncbi:MAG: flagellar hook-associated protein FlgK [Alphaproteobacteria bacterium]|nr:flagellar hook-associated protein FlgK [Alphaproteobacteria bacterium]